MDGSSVTRSVDDLDFRILAAIFGERLWRFTDWDPRISTREIAARVGVAPSTVFERLSGWQASGFLQGYGVLPNPRLLGGRFVGHNVRLADPSAREAFVEAAERIEGVFSFFHHANAWVSVMTFAQSAEASWRQSEQVSRLEGGEHVEPPHVLPEIPPRGRNPDLLDWRIVKALAGWSGHSLVPVAEGLSVSERTVRRRYERMMRDRIVWFFPFLDFAKVKGVVASLIVEFDPKVGYAAVANAMRDRYRDTLRFLSGIETPAGEPYPIWQGLWCLDSVGQAESLIQEVRALPGVTSVEVSYPLRIEKARSTWLADRFEAIIRSVGQTQSVVRPPPEQVR